MPACYGSSTITTPGFVLRSLHTIHQLHPDGATEAALRSGFAYYYQHLFRAGRIPVNDYGAYPVDIHACAESILCCSQLAQTFSPAANRATATLRWTYGHLRDAHGPALKYRKYPFFTSRIAFPRWGIAWTYRAVAEYLHFFFTRQGVLPEDENESGAE